MRQEASYTRDRHPFHPFVRAAGSAWALDDLRTAVSLCSQTTEASTSPSTEDLRREVPSLQDVPPLVA
ncbi:hypothetical protein M2271_008468 [Streptomyces sp. LBL]|nr:hypothetical protein [Streptomyces sp. LBL]